MSGAANDSGVLEGGCFCGAIRYRAVGEPAQPNHCHCADCRRSSGAAFVSWASFRQADFTFTKGTPESYRYDGRTRTFCGLCGTPLTFTADRDPEWLDVTLGSLDEPALVVPEHHIFTEDRLPWVHLADNLPQYKTRRSAG